LFVITAAAADVAVVFRRGPTDWFLLLEWDLASDQVTPGAWFRGRLYPEKCDLSPDGKLLLYFAHQGNKSGSKYTHAWTAVSRSPWLTALTLWPAGTTYGGGGRFVGRRSLVLRQCREPKTHPKHPANGLITECGNPPLKRSEDLVEDAEWSGKDHRGNVLFARDGALYRRPLDGRADRLVADLGGMTPVAQEAPEWARVSLMKG
jgi:hypothetical protein